MNFHVSIPFRFHRFQEALVETLLTAADRMKSDELLRLARHQFTLFEQSAPMDLIAVLRSQRETIVPVGLLENLPSTPTHVNASTNILIDWTGQSDAPRFSVSLATLLSAMRQPHGTPRRFDTRKEIPAVMTMVVSIYLHALLLLHRLGRWLTTDNDQGQTHTEVVFCLVVPEQSALPIPEVATPSPTADSLAWHGGRLAAGPITH